MKIFLSDRSFDIFEFIKTIVNRIDLENLYKLKSISTQYFFLGVTGSGKSLFINYLLGKKIVQKFYDGYKKVLDVENPNNPPIVGHKPNSETYKIDIYPYSDT